MDTQLARQGDKTAVNVDASMLERVLLTGDLSHLRPEDRLLYYKAVCESVGLNPLTKPFEYLELDGKTVLYTRKDATDQLRGIHGVSVRIISREVVEGVYVVTAQATKPDGRIDESIGAVPLLKEKGEWRQAQSGKRYFQGSGEYIPLAPDAKANSIMRAETKAKRRATLSICGLGMIDESELDLVPSRRQAEPPVQRFDSEPPPPAIPEPPPPPPRQAPQTLSRPPEPQEEEQHPAELQKVLHILSNGSREDKLAQFRQVEGFLFESLGEQGGEMYREILGRHGVEHPGNFKSIGAGRKCMVDLWKLVEAQQKAEL